MAVLTADGIRPGIRQALTARGWLPATPIATAGSAASGRQYWRLQTGDGSLILQINRAEDPDVPRFVDSSRALTATGLPVAAIIAIDEDQILMTDLGREQLYDRFIGSSRTDLTCFEQAIGLIRQLQPHAAFIGSAVPWLSARRFDLEHLLWETAYFRDNCWHQRLNPDAGAVNRFDQARQALAERVLRHPQTVVHRDFQSQNVLFSPAAAMVDHQGMRIGSIFYDLASLLFDPYLELPVEHVAPLFQRFCDGHPQIHAASAAWPLFLDAAAQRLMQANGAYGFLTAVRGLPAYEQWRQPGWRQLNILLALHAEAWGPETLASTILTPEIARGG